MILRSSVRQNEILLKLSPRGPKRAFNTNLLRTAHTMYVRFVAELRGPKVRAQPHTHRTYARHFSWSWLAECFAGALCVRHMPANARRIRWAISLALMTSQNMRV